MWRVLQRKLEAAVGGKLIQAGGRKFMKDSELVKKQITLQDGFTVHYYERQGSGPTLLLFHGITDEAKNLAPFLIQLKKSLPDWRMVVPDFIGHGHDLERVRKEGFNFQYPTPQRLLDSMVDFVKALQIQDSYAFGMSLGGGLLYFLQEQHPELVRQAILVNPALESVLDEQFIDDFKQHRKNHFCVENREDIKYFFRDLSCPQRKVKNPVPKFLLEALWQDHLKRVPRGHFRKFFDELLEKRGKDPDWLGCEKDIAPDAQRLVIWPENDYIANYEKGKAFFAESSNTTFHSVPDCGHLFHSNGKTIVEVTAPVMIEYLKQEAAPHAK